MYPSIFESLDMISWGWADETQSSSKLLFFALLYWAMGGEVNEVSSRVFARGIKFMFHHRSYSNVPARPQQYEIMES